MGYTTDFDGTFKLNRPLTEAQAKYLHEFSGTRRMARDVSKMRGYSDPLREAVGLPLGKEGEFFVGAGDSNPDKPKSTDPHPWAGGDCAGQVNSADVTSYNGPPSTQPGLWCQWVPTEDRKGIEWNGGEKFYDYVEWLTYLIKNFLEPWGYKLNGEVKWSGEESGDLGIIIVRDNKVTTKAGRVVFD